MVQKDIMVFVFPVFVLLIVWEIMRYRKNERSFPWKEALISILMAMTYAYFNKHAQPMLASFNQWFYSVRLFDIPVDTFWGLGLLFLAVEFAYYWLHRCSHEIRWFWASHSVHHSPNTITFSGAYRLSITGSITGLFIFFVPLFLLGFSPKAVAGMFSLNLIYQFWLHTEWIPKLSWFEYIFNTPSHHRVHHATNPEFVDRNYGGILIIFDRIFGTFAEERADVPLQYGLIGKAPTLNPLKLFFQEWVALISDVWGATRWRDRFSLAFGRPGWQPEKSHEAGTLHRPLMAQDRTGDQKAYESRPAG